MAEKRMFSRAVVCSDAFLDMPKDAQCLYFQLNMSADDRGFCDCPRKVMRMIGATDDAMKILIAKKFILIPSCNNQVVVVKHWRVNNNLRTQRFKETKYTEILRELFYDENNSYSLNPGDGHVPCLDAGGHPLLPSGDQWSASGQPPVNQWSTNGKPTVDHTATDGIPTVDQRSTQISIDKRREEEIRGDKNNSFILLSQSGEKGESEGGSESGGSPPLPVKSSIPPGRVLTGKEREERVEYLRRCVDQFIQWGFDTTCWYNAAAADGIRPEEIGLPVMGAST